MINSHSLRYLPVPSFPSLAFPTSIETAQPSSAQSIYTHLLALTQVDCRQAARHHDLDRSRLHDIPPGGGMALPRHHSSHTQNRLLTPSVAGLRGHRRRYNRKPPARQPRAVFLDPGALHLRRGGRRAVHPALPPMAAPLLWQLHPLARRPRHLGLLVRRLRPDGGLAQRQLR